MTFALSFISIAAFGACILYQLTWLNKFRRRLIDHHQEKFLELERKSMFPSRSWMLFALSNAHRQLNDPVLDDIGRMVRRMWLPIGAAWLIHFGIIIISI